jgi:phosphatidylglycerophosphate synthase
VAPSGGEKASKSAVHLDTTADERRALAANLDDPLNRWYRYPAARALLRVAIGLPLRPDHITYIHTLIGILGSALVALGGRQNLVLAFVLLEIRMILDCYDGVLARAKKLSSPRGRTLDEIGDAVSFIALCIGMTIHVYRFRPDTPLAPIAAFGVFLLATGAMSGHSYDFYNRRLGSALKDGRDAVAEELAQKRALLQDGRGPAITRFGIWFDQWQVRVYEPRYVGGSAVATVLSRAGRPGVRRLVKLIGLVSWDNGLGLLHIGILFGRVLEAEIVAASYGVLMFLSALVLMRRTLGSTDGLATTTETTPVGGGT